MELVIDMCFHLSGFDMIRLPWEDHGCNRAGIFILNTIFQWFMTQIFKNSSAFLLVWLLAAIHNMDKKIATVLNTSGF